MLKEFKQFALRGSMVDMAVGVIIGSAFGKIISSLVNDVLMPPLGLLIGNMDFSDLAVTLKTSTGTGKPVTLNYGLFINEVVNFTIITFCIFIVIRTINSFRNKQGSTAIEDTEKKCPQCWMSIPIQATRCAHCTSSLI